MTIKTTEEVLVKGIEGQEPEINLEDPNVLEAINNLTGEEPAAGAESEEVAPDPEDKGGGEPAKGEPEGGNKVILSKDGKHTIPFDVLDRERSDKEAAIAAARNLAGVVHALEAKIEELKRTDDPAAGKGGQAVDELQEALDAAKQEIEKAEADYPDMAPANKAILAGLTKMGDRLISEVARQQAVIEELKRHAAQGITEKATAARQSAKEALDQVPALVVWQTKNPELFKLAASFDDTLKADPEWKSKPMAERFAKTVEMVVAVRGPAVLEGVAPVQDNTKGGKKPAAAKSIAEALGITSLSDLPGGQAVSQVPGDLAALSESQLIEKIASIKDDQELIRFMAEAVT